MAKRTLVVKRLSAFVLATLMLISVPALAVIELNEFSSEQIRVRYQALIAELRCPKCQNQNLAESDSAVSIDLRREVLYMLEEGYTDTEIRAFLQQRYGDFILYNPPMAGKTLLVWILPVMLFMGGILVLIAVIRSAARNAAAEDAPESELASEGRETP